MARRYWEPVLLGLLFSGVAFAAAPSDIDRDGDVDLDDFAAFQTCLTGADVAQTGASCQDARLDDDADVDPDDFGIFRDCLTGRDIHALAPCTSPGRRYFPRQAVWYQSISAAPVDAQSSAVITWLQSVGGWGSGQMRIDFSIEVLTAPPGTPLQSFIPTGDFYTPDCDAQPMPVPPGGALEGESGYECAGDGDCHLIVADDSRQKLFEMWRANIINGTFYGGCLAVWDMTRVYGPAGRGENCTSADAAGYPIAPLLFSTDEVAGGWIDHAIRFILPNSRIRHGVYLHPATHSTSATSGPATAPPYGARLRLRADYPLQTLPNEAARVVARAMQRYGILLADGGTIALTAQSDRFSAAKWHGLLGAYDLSALHVNDFEMIDGGNRITYTGDCVRAP